MPAGSNDPDETGKVYKMKMFRNILLLAVLLAGAMSCVKEEGSYDDREISMNPVSSYMSKSLPGPVSGTVYPTEETFGVFAYYSSTEAGDEWTDSGQIYISGQEIRHKEGTSFGGVNP